MTSIASGDINFTPALRLLEADFSSNLSTCGRVVLTLRVFKAISLVGLKGCLSFDLSWIFIVIGLFLVF